MEPVRKLISPESTPTAEQIRRVFADNLEISIKRYLWVVITIA